MYASPRTQSANPVRELNGVSESDTLLSLEIVSIVMNLFMLFERLITKDDLALNANDCIISGMPKANRVFIVQEPIQ